MGPGGSFSSTSTASGGEPVDVQIKQRIKFLRSKCSETGMELDRCKQEQETFSVNHHTYVEKTAKQDQMSKQVHFYWKS